MEYDSIILAEMRPDASLYEKGLRLVKNVAPWDAGAWRELDTAVPLATIALPADSSFAGSYSSPANQIFLATAREAGPSGRLYRYDPAGATLTNLTPGTDYAGTPRWWRFTSYGSSVIAAPENVNTGAAIQLQVSTGGNFANLVTSADRPAPKFVGACKSYVVGAYNLAFGGAGLYAVADPYKVMWCSRNNAAIWTPGVDRAGFVSLKDALGQVTGLACFAEFFLVFQELGVTRFTWAGGDTLWEQQAIAGPAFGIANPLHSDAIITTDRDAYYRSRSGFATITNGEVAGALLPEAERFFREGTEYPISIIFPVVGTYHSLRNAAIWTANRGDAYFQIVLELDTGRCSILDGQNWPGLGVGTHEVETTAAFSSLVFMGVTSTNDLTVSSFRVSDPRSVQAGSWESLRWRPVTGKRRKIAAVRPLVLVNLNGDTYPPLTLEIATINDPVKGTEATCTVTSASRDENGWWTDAAFPLAANEFVYKLTYGANASAAQLREALAIEVAFSESSVF